MWAIGPRVGSSLAAQLPASTVWPEQGQKRRPLHGPASGWTLRSELLLCHPSKLGSVPNHVPMMALDGDSFGSGIVSLQTSAFPYQELPHCIQNSFAGAKRAHGLDPKRLVIKA
eukprot:579612-Pelagomonas_calceolata.AAC.1